MIDPGRVRDAAEGVLARPSYAELRPDPLGRLLAEARSWFAERVFGILDGGAAAGLGVLVAVLLVVLVLVLAGFALAGVQRRATSDLVVEEEAGLRPADAAAAADRARATGDHVTAVRRRYGALVLELVERDVLPAVPGTTVGEVDRAVALAAPACAAAVHAAGATLADIVYGHRTAGPGDDDLVATALAAVRRAVPSRAVAL